MAVSFPGIRLLQGTLFPGLLAVGITHTFTVAEGVFVIKQQGFVDIIYLIVYLRRKFGSEHTGKRQSCLIGDDV